jgi:ATP-dependent Lon protease
MINKKLDNKSSVKLKSLLAKQESNDLTVFIIDKITYIREIIRNTIISIKSNKIIEIFSNNDTNLSISILNDLYEKTNDIQKKLQTSNTQKDFDTLLDLLQKIIDKLSLIICGFGTKYINDLLYICFGSEYKYIKIENPIIKAKYDLIQPYIKPIGYKIVNWKSSKTANNNTNNSNSINYCVNKITDETIIIEDAPTFECFDVDINTRLFYQKIYGIRVIIQNETLRKTIIINGIIEDIQLDCFTNLYIEHRKKEILELSVANPDEHKIIQNIVDTMSFKDVLIYGNEDIKKKLHMIITESNYVKNTKLDIIIKKFLDLDIYSQRSMLMNLLLYTIDDEIKHICYLLYELITVNTVDTSESNEQIYETLPFKIKSYFKDVIKYTIKNTTEITQKYDMNKITLEQQIYLLKANDSVKEKAMAKLKEIKGKSEDFGSKAKQYLDGLLKIPFHVYREEPILKKMKEFNIWYQAIASIIEKLFPTIGLIKKKKYTIIEIEQNIRYIEKFIDTNVLIYIEKILQTFGVKQITQLVKYINNYQKIKKENNMVIITKNQSKETQIKNIVDFLKENKITWIEIYDKLIQEYSKEVKPVVLSKTIYEMKVLQENTKSIDKMMDNIMNILDDSIYGHTHAKKQILKIIGQWMNGEQTGYCFGFEGSPGVGKTSLAKNGLAKCLTEADNSARPFSFIALGGSCNGSSIEGHGYTYMNSNWGRIVDILMESKCMNPIIYIDELDKVSKTENGREIIGILTHLIDSTQNDAFQDKYFSGIHLDLSKALFIFSYNDVEQIDHILLDRIHRIKFDNLSLKEKIIIMKIYILPEINDKMGFEDVVEISDEMIEYIIQTYTIEPGVRKLKEIVFDLYGEINLDILKHNFEKDTQEEIEKISIPIKLTIDLLENKYLKKYKKINEKKIHNKAEIGVINGLWANSLGRGGIIPIQSFYFPSATFLDLKLTGLQGDVMKESMNVAKTLAWNLTPDEDKKELLKYFEETKCQGLHIHCPEGAVSKDGPSAGTAITVSIYSLLNKKTIRNDVAITGEITLQGDVTEIGGLDIKITGAIRAGVKKIIYPKSNNRDFIEWRLKNDVSDSEMELEFIEVSNINEVFQHVFITE